MSNSWYDGGRAGFATAQVNWPVDTIRVSCVDLADYTPNLATHQYFSDIPSGAVVASAPLLNKTAAAGVLKADNTTVPNVTGDQFELLVIWKDTGTPTSSRLLILVDTGAGIPAVPNGAGIDILWNPAGIARL